MKAEPKSIPRGIRIPAAVDQALQQIAQRERRTFSQVVIMACETYINAGKAKGGKK